MCIRDRLLRIGAELIDASDGHVLWSHHYDLAPEAVLSVQDEIARGVATALAVRIDSERLRRAVGKPLDSLEAYDCWLRGVAELHRGTPDSHEPVSYTHLDVYKRQETRSWPGRWSFSGRPKGRFNLS